LHRNASDVPAPVAISCNFVDDGGEVEVRFDSPTYSADQCNIYHRSMSLSVQDGAAKSNMVTSSVPIAPGSGISFVSTSTDDVRCSSPENDANSSWNV